MGLILITGSYYRCTPPPADLAAFRESYPGINLDLSFIVRYEGQRGENAVARIPSGIQVQCPPPWLSEASSYATHQAEGPEASWEKLERARILLTHAVGSILSDCGNNYANANTEEWLANAKELNAYFGKTKGNITELAEEWENSLNIHGLPDFPPLKTEH